MLNKKEIEEVLKKIIIDSSDDPEVEEFCRFYLELLEGFDKEKANINARASRLFLNLKMALRHGASWVEGNERRWRANRIIYSSQYNKARDLVRHALEAKAAEKGEEEDCYHWDHLEVFPTREMLPRRQGEKATEAKKRHLHERTVPYLSSFLKVANATKERDVYREIIEEWAQNKEKLLYLEALASGYKEKDLEEEGLGHFPLRKNMIHLVRAIRWGEIDPRRELARLEVLQELPQIAGPILRKKMGEFMKLLSQGEEVERLRRYVVATVGEEEGKPILNLLEKLEKL